MSQTIDSRGEEGLETGARDSILYALRVLCRRVARLSSNLTVDTTRSMTYIVDIISHRGKTPIPGRLRRLHFELYTWSGRIGAR